MDTSFNSQETPFSLAKAILVIIGVPLLSLGAGIAIAIGSIALAIGIFLVTNPFVGISALAIFLKAKSAGATTEKAMAESGISALAKPDALEKLWKIIREILS